MSEIEKLVAAKKWSRARALIQEELISDPTDHWLWTTLGLTYYEEREYEKAVECSTRAVELAPDCPLALWDYAGSLLMAGRDTAALAIWTLLLEMDLEQVAYGECGAGCGEGMDWALQLINDVHYRLGNYFQWKGEKEKARASFQKYLHNRAHGVGSIYDAKTAEQDLAMLGLDGNGSVSIKSAQRAEKP